MGTFRKAAKEAILWIRTTRQRAQFCRSTQTRRRTQHSLHERPGVGALVSRQADSFEILDAGVGRNIDHARGREEAAPGAEALYEQGLGRPALLFVRIRRAPRMEEEPLRHCRHHEIVQAG